MDVGETIYIYINLPFNNIKLCISIYAILFIFEEKYVPFK